MTFLFKNTNYFLVFCFIYFQTYYVTITAITSAGYVEVTSDGVTVVEENSPLKAVIVLDGEACDNGMHV